MEEENTAVQESKGLSIASMVLGLVGLIIFPLPCGILAIIFSVLGRKKGGKGFATAGLITGIIDVVYGIISIISATLLISSLF